MTGMGAAGPCTMGGHEKKALECPQGPGRRYLSRMATARNQQEKHKQRQKSATKALTTGGLLVTSQQAKRAEQKEVKPHETSRNNTSNKHGQHKQQKYWHIIFVKKQQKAKIKNRANVKQQGISFTMPKQQVEVEWGGKGERKNKTGRINSATTQQTRARKMRLS